MYQYTDNQGVVHFTDNPQKIPAKLLEKSKKEAPSSLSTIKPSVTEQKLQNNQDGVEGYQGKYDDPVQIKDPRLSTPESALGLFLSALRIGNLIDCKASVTGWFWHWYSASSQQAIKKDLLQKDKNRVFRLLVEDREPPRVEASTVLMDLQQEVGDVPVPVGHTL